MSPGERARRSTILFGFLLAIPGGYELGHDAVIGWTLIGVAVFTVTVVSFTVYWRDRKKRG